jgi:hypothetical protein
MSTEMEIDGELPVDGIQPPGDAPAVSVNSGIPTSNADTSRIAGTGPLTATSSGTNNASRPEIKNKLDLGTVYQQCSSARSSVLSLSVTEIADGDCKSNTGTAPIIGSLDWSGDQSTLKTFYGARVNKSGRTVNECISCSFDPRNLFCIGCGTPHHILGGEKPVVLIFADQNFVPFLSHDPENCIAIVRLENPSLSELVDIAGELLDRFTLPEKSILLFGSGSHLFRGGAAQYAADWISLSNRCNQKWPKSVILPLVPIIRTESPGSLVRDISLISAWFIRVYANSDTGMLKTWTKILYYAESNCAVALSPEVCKLPLPYNTSLGSTQTHCFMFHSSCPDLLQGMDHKATGELLYTIIDSLNMEHEADLNANLIIANSWVTDPGPPNKLPEEQPVPVPVQAKKTLVIAGASNMRRLIPALRLAGYEIIDLSQPSWLATAENIELLANRIVSLDLGPDSVLIIELFGNSTFRYRQFDDTMALPFKSGHGYHMEGEVGVCDDSTFGRLINAARPVFDACGTGTKIIVPPLPRYLYAG